MSSDMLLRRRTVIPPRARADTLDTDTSTERPSVRDPERFVSADEAAQFLAINRRHLLVLARNGIRGAYPAGTGSKRNHWVFRLSELAAAITEKRTA
jgi:hypothetical protein